MYASFNFWGKEPMAWTENSVLINYSKTTPCKDIFQAVCDELGKHYEKKGFKYSRSKPKIVYKDEAVKLEICFFSSASNTPGEFVNLEILPNFYSTDLAKHSRIKGFLFGHTGILNKWAKKLTNGFAVPKKFCTDYVGHLKVTIEYGGRGQVRQSCEYSSICEWETLNKETQKLNKMLNEKFSGIK